MARTLSYQVGILTVGRIVAYAAVFFVPLMNVRTLSVHDYGLYRQYWLLFETIAGILVLGFPNSLLYYFPRADSRDEKSAYMTQTLIFLFGMGLVSCGAYGILYSMLGENLGSVVKEYYWALCLFTLFMIVSRAMDRQFVAERQVERQSLYHAVTATIQASTVILVSYYTRRVDLIIWALVIFAAAKFAFVVAYNAGAYRISTAQLSLRAFREQLSYALPLGLAGTVLLLLTQTDKFVITHYVGREMFAIYAIGAFQVPFVDIIRSSISNVIFPLMARHQKDGNPEEILRLWQTATLKTAVLFYPIFVFLEASAKPFITILFTDQYAGAVPVFMIYLLLFLRQSVETGAVLMVYKKNSYLLKVNIATFVLNVILSIAGFKMFGMLGVPAATVIVIYLQNALNLLLARELLETPFHKLMPWGRLGARLLTAAVPGALLYLGYQHLPVDNVIILGVAGLVYFTVYFALCFGLRFISLSEIKAIFGQSGS